MMKQVRKWASLQTEVASLLGTFPLMLCTVVFKNSPEHAEPWFIALYVSWYETKKLPKLSQASISGIS